MEDREELERRVGTTLRGKWTLEKLLGVGGMAAVYVGRHEIGRREAIKILHTTFARDKELRKRFEREATAANRFKHPGAVEIHDVDIAEDGSPFLVMELLEGESVGARAERGAVPPAEMLRWMDELLDVLAAAHAEGIVHRDIKPDNLFLMQDGRLKVLDFGIARMRQGDVSSLHTKAGALLGTLSYMPPEQILGEQIDHRADLFSVGATMFRLLARRRMHEAASETDMVVKMATLAAPKLATVVPGVNPHVALVVDRALAFAKTDRYPEASTMQADVRAVREGREPPHAARLASLGLDPGQGAVAGAGGGPPHSISADPTRMAMPAVTGIGGMSDPNDATRVTSMSATGATGATGVTGVTGVTEGAGGWAPRSVATAPKKRKIEPWMWAAGGGALLVAICAIVAASCGGGDAPHEPGPAVGPAPGPAQQQQEEPRKMRRQGKHNRR